jgi:hypothetical protein
MGFLDKLFGRKKKEKEEETAAPSKSTSTRAGARRTTSPQEEISRVYVYVGATVPINAQIADQITTYALDVLKADATFRKIWAKVERDKVPMVKGHGTAPSSGQFVNAFARWLQTKGTSLDQAKTVMGKSIFVQGGDSHNPADGSKFSWALLGCFQ